MPRLRSNRRREPVSTRKRWVAFEHKGIAGRLRSYLDSIWRNILLRDVQSGCSIRSSLTHFAFSTLIWLRSARDHGKAQMLDTIFIIAAIGTAAALCFFGLFYRF
jgi:hypothetical protein